MDSHRLFDWFKGTVPGIVLLGAFGSLLAILVIKLLKTLLKRLEHLVGNRLFFPMLRIWYQHKSLASRYLKSNQAPKLLTYTAWVFGKYWVYSVLFVISFAATVLFFAIAGLRVSFAAFLLITCTFVCLIMWAKYGIASSAVQEAVLDDDIEKEEARFKGMNKKAFFAEIKKLDATDTDQ